LEATQVNQKELAAEVGVSDATISKWRSRGLLAACSGGNYGNPLTFGPIALERARFIKALIIDQRYTLNAALGILGRMEVEEWR
jgi:hypothetical protein